MKSTKPAPKDRSSDGGLSASPSSRSTLRRRLLAAGLLCWAGFGLVAVLTLTGQTTAWDHAGMLVWRFGPDLAPRGPHWLLPLAVTVTLLGDTALRYVIALGVAGALLLRHKLRAAIVLIATLLSGWLVQAALKVLVGRPRPDFVPHLVNAGGPSFPSAHSFNAALVYIAIALVLAASRPAGRARIGLIAAAIAVSALIAFTRVWLGVHFPSDAIAGWLGGAAWAFTAAALLDRPAQVAAQAATEAT